MTEPASLQRFTNSKPFSPYIAPPPGATILSNIHKGKRRRICLLTPSEWVVGEICCFELERNAQSTVEMPITETNSWVFLFLWFPLETLVLFFFCHLFNLNIRFSLLTNSRTFFSCASSYNLGKAVPRTVTSLLNFTTICPIAKSWIILITFRFRRHVLGLFAVNCRILVMIFYLWGLASFSFR